ncbi:MAG: hypothetical protein NTV54_11830 [Ignavibacteriales bacterium]|nr:hypothetical protein [Ignavibacteriales bacterium]
MAIVWMVVGSLMVVVPFLLFDNPIDPWPSIIAGGIGGTLFVMVFVFYVLWKTPFSKLVKVVSVSISLIAIVGTVISWTTMYEMSHFQQSLLKSIRTSIGYTILQDCAYGLVLPPLRTYHEQKASAHSPIGKIFLATNRERIHDGFCRVPDEPCYFDIRPLITDSVVTLTMVDSVAHGDKDGFANANGLRGRLQVSAVLTEKGVRYERQN